MIEFVSGNIPKFHRYENGQFIHFERRLPHLLGALDEAKTDTSVKALDQESLICVIIPDLQVMSIFITYCLFWARGPYISIVYIL